MTATVNLGLPYIEAAQAQKHVTHNEALQILDALVQLAVLDRDLNTPPASPAEGQRWLVKASPAPTGAWSGHGNHVAAWRDGAWQFSIPRIGWVAFVVDEITLAVWNGSAWSDFFATTSIQNLVRLGLGTSADATNPFSAKLNNVLWVAKSVAEGGDGHLRYKLSKESATNTLSLLFENNYSGRAECGLIGDDDFRFKVSADGSSWQESLVLKAASGQLQVTPTTDAVSVGTGAAYILGGASIAKKLYMGDALWLPRGSAALPALAFDSGTGFWSPAEDTLAWSTGGAERLRLTSSGLGIGGTPAYQLDVFGGGGIGMGDVGRKKSFVPYLTSPYDILRITSIGSTGFWRGTIYCDLSYNFAAPFTAFALVANSDGTTANAGFGTTVPAKTVDIVGTLQASGIVSLTSTVTSSSPTTGALTIGGGAGVGGSIFCGGIFAAAKALPTVVATSTIDTDARLWVYHNSAANWAGIGADPSGDFYVRVGVSASNFLIVKSSGQLRATFYSSASTLQTDTSGNIVNTSDAAKKRILGSFLRDDEDLARMDPPVLFQWLHETLSFPDVTNAGFVAQHVQKGIPEAIGRNPDGSLSLNLQPILAAATTGLMRHRCLLLDHEERLAAIENRLR